VSEMPIDRFWRAMWRARVAFAEFGGGTRLLRA